MIKETISYVSKFKYIILYFDEKFLEKAINNFYTRKNNELPFHHIANFICWSYCKKEFEFFTELDKMLEYFYSKNNLQEYLLSPKIRKHLKSKDETEFHSTWSEIIFAFFLHKNKLEILKMGQKKGEATERADIITNNGLFEVTVVLSDKDQYSSGEVFFGSNKIEDVSMRIINNKIKNKSNQNEANQIVIDCTFMDSLYEKLISSYIPGMKTDFGVFKKIKKSVFLFSRNTATHQVGIIKRI